MNFNMNFNITSIPTSIQLQYHFNTTSIKVHLGLKFFSHLQSQRIFVYFIGHLYPKGYKSYLLFKNYTPKGINVQSAIDIIP